MTLRLKKGGPSSPHDMLWPSEPKAHAEALLRFAERELYPHFDLEETALFPSAAGHYIEIIALLLKDQHPPVPSYQTFPPKMNYRHYSNGYGHSASASNGISEPRSGSYSQ